MSASVLVTGYPGLRARFVVRELLVGEPDTEIVALVHPGRRADAELAREALAGGERLRLLSGDPAAIDFGLGAARYRELAASVRLVHHCYQVLDRGAEPEVALVVNVGGAREMIELARVATGLERIVHHSSVFVSGDRTGLVLEEELACGQKFRSPVEESLAVAERMLRGHAHVPLSVVRAGEIVGDSRTGEIDRLQGVYPLWVFLASAPQGATIPLPPRPDAFVHLVPIDYVARAACFLGRSPQAHGETVHLIDGGALDARRLVELSAARFGQRVEPGLNAAAFGRALFGNAGVRLLVKNLRAVLDLITSTVDYDERNARRLLAGSGIECPPLEAYLDVLLEDVERRVRERRLGEPRSEACHAAG